MSGLYETILQVRVLSEGSPIDTTDLTEIAYQMDQGDYVGDVTVVDSTKLTKGQMVTALHEVRSDASFFSQCESAKEKPLDLKNGTGTWVIVGRIPDQDDMTEIFHNMTLSEAKKAFEKVWYENTDSTKNEIKKYYGTTIYYTSIVRVQGTAVLIADRD